MKEHNQIFFKLENIVRDFEIGTDENYSFTFSDTHEIHIDVRQPSLSDQEKGYKKENSMCTATLMAKVSKKNFEIFTKISENKILQENQFVAMSYRTKEEIEIKLPPFQKLPEGFISCINQISSELKNAIKFVIDSMRWRCGLLGPHNPQSSRGLFWSFDNENWHPAPQNFQVRVDVINRKPAINDYILNNIQNLLNSKIDEPIYHELFREAWELKNNNLRSAVLVGFSSLETAVKICISTISPRSEWLIQNLPSPPIERIMRDYFPILLSSDDRNSVLPTKRLIDIVKNGTLLRNKIAHLGSPPPKYEEVQTILNAIRDCLWIIDYNCGNDWALEKISHDTRLELFADCV